MSHLSVVNRHYQVDMRNRKQSYKRNLSRNPHFPRKRENRELSTDVFEPRTPNSTNVNNRRQIRVSDALVSLILASPVTREGEAVSATGIGVFELKAFDTISLWVEIMTKTPHEYYE